MGVGTRNHVLDGVPDSPAEKGTFGEVECPWKIIRKCSVE